MRVRSSTVMPPTPTSRPWMWHRVLQSHPLHLWTSRCRVLPASLNHCAAPEKDWPRNTVCALWPWRKGDRSRHSLLQRAADLDPRAPGVWSDLARAALDESNFNNAENYSHQAIEADQN